MTDNKEREPLYLAAINCPHEIDDNRIVLHYDDKQPGHNALAQLGDRLARAALDQQPATPPGFALVPIEPTMEMIAAARPQYSSNPTGSDAASVSKYKRMVEAAPKLRVCAETQTEASAATEEQIFKLMKLSAQAIEEHMTMMSDDGHAGHVAQGRYYKLLDEIRAMFGELATIGCAI